MDIFVKLIQNTNEFTHEAKKEGKLTFAISSFFFHWVNLYWLTSIRYSHNFYDILYSGKMWKDKSHYFVVRIEFMVFTTIGYKIYIDIHIGEIDVYRFLILAQFGNVYIVRYFVFVQYALLLIISYYT